VVSQSCFGGYLAIQAQQGEGAYRVRTLEECIGLSFLTSRAAAFLGPTSVTYGTTAGGELGASDVLAHEFLKAAMEGLPLGQALRHARHALSQKLLRGMPPHHVPRLAHQVYKTLLQFVLYGDPSAHSKTQHRFVQAEPLEERDIPGLKTWVPVGLAPSAARPGMDGWRQVSQLQAPTAEGTAVLKVFRRQIRLGGDDIVQSRLRLEPPDGTIHEEQSLGGISVQRLGTQPNQPGSHVMWIALSSFLGHAIEASRLWLRERRMAVRGLIALPLWRTLRRLLVSARQRLLVSERSRTQQPGGHLGAREGGHGIRQQRKHEAQPWA
jgi:hypothetical protein